MFRKLFCISLLVAAVIYSGVLLWARAAPSPQTVSSKSTFRPALPGYQFSFPRDHGAHPAFQTEWWYYTGHLQATDGTQLGYELTFFRYGLIPQQPPGRSAWAVRDVDFAHFAITDQTHQKYFYSDRMERANMGLAGTEAGKVLLLPRLWIDNWSLQFKGNRGNTQILQASGTAQNQDGHLPMSIHLTQQAIKPPVINGQNGISKKGPSANAASHYYSMPRLATRGELTLGKTRYQVSGQSWLDREFGSGGLSPGQNGWDWFAIQLDDGRDLMLYQIREKGGLPGPYSAGTLTDKNGKSTFITREDFKIAVTQWWKSPHTGARYPAAWKIDVPRYHLSLNITPTVADQEMRPRHENTVYWEGSCRVAAAGKSTFTPLGKAYVELTGYH